MIGTRPLPYVDPWPLLRDKLTLDEVTALREVYLVAHAQHMRRSVARVGLEGVVRKVSAASRLSQGVWLAVASMPKDKARELVDRVNDALRWGRA